MSFEHIVPFFLILVAGYAAVRFKYIPDALVDGLAQFVFTVAMPVLVFGAMLRSSVIDRSFGNLMGMVAMVALAVAATMALGIVVARYVFKADLAKQQEMAVAASHSNVILLGYPAAVLILSTQAVSALTFLVGIHGFVLAVLVLAMQVILEKKKVDFKSVALDQTKNPILMALVVGVVFGRMDVNLSPQVDIALHVLGGVSAGCGLFAFGGWMVRGTVVKDQDRLQWLGAMAGLKLLVLPLLFWLIAKKIAIFGIHESWIWMAILVIAMPPGFELQAKGKPGGAKIADETIFMGSLAAIVTVSVIIHLM